MTSPWPKRLLIIGAGCIVGLLLGLVAQGYEDTDWGPHRSAFGYLQKRLRGCVSGADLVMCMAEVDGYDDMIVECQGAYDRLKTAAEGCAQALALRIAEEEGPAVAHAPNAMCIEVIFSASRIGKFDLRVSFWEPSRGWVATPDWTQSGFRFDADMGLGLAASDRRFLRNGGGRTTYPDMILVAGEKGNIAYRSFGTVDDLGMLICGELDWNRIRVPGELLGEEP